MKKQISFVIVIMMMIAMACCVANEINTVPKEINHVSALPGYDIDSLYKAFLECSKDEGDLGCDSCWAVIMEGYVDDSYWHDHANSYISAHQKKKEIIP